jgi:hypothetical protein
VILINNYYHNITIPFTLKVICTSVLTTLTGNNGTVSHLHGNIYYLPYVLSMTSTHWNYFLIMSSLERFYYVILLNNHHHIITIPFTLKVTDCSVLTTLTGNNGTVRRLHGHTYYLPHVLSMASTHWNYFLIMSSLEQCYYVIFINNHNHNITIPSTLKVTDSSVLTTLTGDNGTVSHLHGNTYYIPHVLSMISTHWNSFLII